MKYLLDTHALLWIVTDSPKLSRKAKKLYLDTDNIILFSMASIWELSIKSSLGKIEFDKTLENFVEEHIKGNNIQILNIELPHILRVEQLPFYHRDPFDRLLIAQLMENNLSIISYDKMFDPYKVKRIW